MGLPPGTPARKRLRRLMMGLATLFGLAPRGWFIPYRYAGTPVPPASYPALDPLFQDALSDMRALLRDAEIHAPAFARFQNAEPPLPRWQQDWYPRLDGLAGYSLVHRLRPKRLVEVGSGHSTRFFSAAVTDAGVTCVITAIDPAPRADLSRLAGVSLHQSVVQDADPALFEALEAGDILAIDSSHIAMPGSDVDWLVGRVLPTLPVGVILAVHDIFLPDGYPESWAWRGYNEQAIFAALLAGGGWRVLWSSHVAATHLKPEIAGGVAGTLPLTEGVDEGALWLERVSTP